MKILPKENPGISFEKMVAEIQSQIDPDAEVIHDEKLIDRLGQTRQFDVVIKGQFAGQDLLGIIECKDLNRKVGTPEIDAFVTKSADVNANFKIVVSRKGFSGPALEKAKHYGIQTLSLLPNDPVNAGFKVGNYWFADIYFWEKITIDLDFVEKPKEPVSFKGENVRVGGSRVLDWFTNYLLEHHKLEDKLGWVVGVGVQFDQNQNVEIAPGQNFLCKGISFYALRAVAKKKRFVGINGTGFFDWQKNKATLPAQDNIKTDAVETDFMKWEDRQDDHDALEGGFLNIKIVGFNEQFKLVGDMIELEKL